MEYFPDDAFFLSVFTGEALGAILSPRHLNVGNIQPLIPLNKANNLGSWLLHAECDTLSSFLSPGSLENDEISVPGKNGRLEGLKPFYDK